MGTLFLRISEILVSGQLSGNVERKTLLLLEKIQWIKFFSWFRQLERLLFFTLPFQEHVVINWNLLEIESILNH